MKLLSSIFLVALTSPFTLAQSSTSAAPSATTSTSVSPDYTITALPAVQSAPTCLFNCLIPIGLADPSGCDDVSNDCACLSAPADVLDFLTGCVQTVCSTSTSGLEASATSLYESYCNSVYGTAVFSSAFVAEASAAASGSVSADASTTSAGSKTSSSASGSASSTAKSSGSVTLEVNYFLFIGAFAILGGLFSFLL